MRRWGVLNLANTTLWGARAGCAERTVTNQMHLVMHLACHAPQESTCMHARKDSLRDLDLQLCTKFSTQRLGALTCSFATRTSHCELLWGVRVIFAMGLVKEPSASSASPCGSICVK